MILKKATIANYLSITGSIEFDLDNRATILLGANDHGKSNILKALCCLAAAAEGIDLPVDLRGQIAAKWEESKDVEGITRGKWFKDTAKSFLDGEEASKVALARTYAFRCREKNGTPIEGIDREVALALCNSIAKELALPSIKAKEIIEA